MCGICGILSLNGATTDTGVIQSMTDALAHRGPDGQGTFIDEPVALGHRRLAILDLSEAGSQPMHTGDKRFTITYNGEIYNFHELRKELEELGHHFKSWADTEVILLGYAQWGRQVVERLNGMFAFAIWDSQRQELFLARDRYGIKPLYFMFSDGRFLFGSEQKAILKHPSVRRDLDLEALLEYFTFQNIFTDKTFLQGIKTFPAGYTAVLRALGAAELKLEQYWDYDFREPDYPLSEAEYVEELDYLFSRAVKRQLLSDVEVGTYLSGGMDSGSITAVAASVRNDLKTFTCGFDLHSASGLELAFDEREMAEHMSYLYKTEHYEMILKAGDMERCLPDLAWHLEEPRVGQSYPNYYVAKLASKFVKVALGGAGGDELFGGYPWRYYRAAVCNDFEDYIDKYYIFWQRLIPNKALQQVFSPVWKDVSHVWTRDIFRDVFGEKRSQPCTPYEYVNNSLYFEAKTFLHGLLSVKDKLSMAHGLETRVPFLDNDLVDFAMQVPVDLKLGNLNKVVRINENEPGKLKIFFEKTRDGKQILRKMMRNYAPREITEGIKKGFSAPDASWFKGESIRYVSETLIKKKARIYDYMDQKAISGLVMEHLEGKHNRRLLIWSLLNVERWIEKFIDC